MANKSGIHIDPKNKGKLHKKMGVKKGKKIPTKKLNSTIKSAKKSGNTKLEREAVFAKNAKKWSKK